MNGKTLVTGGAGLVGHNIVRLLNQLGHTNILIVDRLRSCPHKWKNLRGLHFADYVDADDFAADDFRRGTRETLDVDTILHFGATSATTEKNAAYLLRNNVEFSQWLATRAGQIPAKFVYASSAATYGAGIGGWEYSAEMRIESGYSMRAIANSRLERGGLMRDTDDSPEYLASLHPLNPYGLSKSLFDLFLAKAGGLRERGLGEYGAVGLKLFNCFGGPERHKDNQCSLVCKAYDRLREGLPIQLFRSARDDIRTEDIRRDFLSVKDAAKVAVWFALDSKGRQQHGLFNVGSGVATSFTELATHVARNYRDRYTVESGGDFPPIQRAKVWYNWLGEPKHKWLPLDFPYIEYIEMPDHLRAKYQYYTCADISKLRRVGYMEEFTPIREAVSEYVGELASEQSDL